MIPAKKARTTATEESRGMGEVANNAVRRDETAEGPRVMSFAEPNTTYTKLPMNAEYNPT